jgi:DNA/RNA-binding domain of Phe-tRNA-synthetase-like protein
VSDPRLREGAVAGELRREFPRLGLTWTEAPIVPRRSPRAVRRRLRDLSSRLRGAQAIVQRQAPVHHAYRVFFRQIGLDPDADRPPAEAAVVERLLRGEFPSRGLPDDALTIALVETGVPLWALDADRVGDGLELRLSAPGEQLGRGERALPLPADRIVVADPVGPVAVVFGAAAPGLSVTRETRRAALFAVRVEGVPAIHVEEAMWTCLEVLETA